MKALFLLLIISLSLTACAPDAKDSYLGTKIYGYSNDVTFELAGAEENSPNLPPQVSVILEKPDPKFSKLKVLPYAIETVLISPSSVVKIGCDGAGTDMPEVLNADTVILCGDLSFEKETFSYTANTIILDSANIKIISTFEDLKYRGVNFRAQEKIILRGPSHIILQGRTRNNNAGLESPPRLTIATPSFEEDGTLRVTSKSNYLIYGK